MHWHGFASYECLYCGCVGVWLSLVQPERRRQGVWEVAGTPATLIWDVTWLLRFIQADTCAVPPVGRGHFLHNAVHFIVRQLSFQRRQCLIRTASYRKWEEEFQSLLVKPNVISVVWDVRPCSLLYVNPRFEENFFHLQGRSFIVKLRRRRLFLHPHPTPPATLHGATYQKTVTRVGYPPSWETSLTNDLTGCTLLQIKNILLMYLVSPLVLLLFHKNGQTDVYAEAIKCDSSGRAAFDVCSGQSWNLISQWFCCWQL